MINIIASHGSAGHSAVDTNISLGADDDADDDRDDKDRKEKTPWPGVVMPAVRGLSNGPYS